jgi:hypothetical protein
MMREGVWCAAAAAAPSFHPVRARAAASSRKHNRNAVLNQNRVETFKIKKTVPRHAAAAPLFPPHLPPPHLPHPLTSPPTRSPHLLLCSPPPKYIIAPVLEYSLEETGARSRNHFRNLKFSNRESDIGLMPRGMFTFYVQYSWPRGQRAAARY